ncbi:GTPase [Aquimarina sp. MMG015]|uniref:GTPase n=1 Tax=unclassified Aquimarina TaxID=2627091 RepID=UPI0011C432F2|nr:MULTISPECIES: GTPase [unclassified Aquimarina]MBQ4803019.1 GTPase [Aquimarina sp. MMG015]
MKRTILFVYNADSSSWNKYLDFAHKIISPSTYSCGLCNLTHGNFSEKKVWKVFREKSSNTMIFSYKNEFLKKHKKPKYQELIFPVILEQKKSGLEILVKSEELKSIKSVEDLIEILSVKLI